MRSIWKALASCMTILCLFGNSTLAASAHSADDVAAKARQAGWPEYLVQAGLNEWSTGNYSQSDLDEAYNSVEKYSENMGEKLANAFGVDYVSSVPATDAPAQTPSDNSAGTQQAGQSAVSGENTSADAGNTLVDSGETPAAAADTPAGAGETPATAGTAAPSAAVSQPSATLVVTKTDGTSEERISKEEFIKMPLEEKKAYVAELTDDSKSDFMNSLTIEERNSIIKQLPAEDKAELIQTYIDAAKNMGMNVAVDNIDDNQVSMTIRNKEGQIIGKNAVGMIVDETGISHTGEWMTALLAVLASVFGFILLYRYISRTE